MVVDRGRTGVPFIGHYWTNDLIRSNTAYVLEHGIRNIRKGT